jgi:hypothetical protein
MINFSHYFFLFYFFLWKIRPSGLVAFRISLKLWISQIVGMTPWTGVRSIARPLPAQMCRKHSCSECDSNTRSQSSSGRKRYQFSYVHCFMWYKGNVTAKILREWESTFFEHFPFSGSKWFMTCLRLTRPSSFSKRYYREDYTGFRLHLWFKRKLFNLIPNVKCKRAKLSL